MSASSFAADVVTGAKVPVPSRVGAIIGDMSADNPSGRRLIDATQESYGGSVSTRVSDALKAVWNASPFSLTDKVSVPLAKSVEKVGAGTQAALAGVGSGAASAGEGVKNSIEDVGRKVSNAVFWVLLAGGLLVMLYVVGLVKGAAK